MMKKNIQIERVFSELKRGEKIIICDNLSQISVLLSAAERINNTTLKEHTRLGHSNPTIILSNTQTKGRGTRGKKWISKKGNLFITPEGSILAFREAYLDGINKEEITLDALGYTKNNSIPDKIESEEDLKKILFYLKE